MNAQDRMASRKWGIFNHYLYYSEKGYTDYRAENPEEIRLMAGEWNRQVESFDTERLARTLHGFGCGYYMITVMQGTRFLIAPNAAYSRITGIAPGEGCARRDLIRDIGEALRKYDIDLYLYYTGDGPHFDKIAGPRMGLYEDYEAGLHGRVDRNFVNNWAAVLGEYAERFGYGVIRDYVGHGVGAKLHEPPEVPNYGRPGHGPRLAAGQTIAVEPMVSAGTYEVRVLDNDWTVVTADGSLSAHYENSILITDGEPEILTIADDI